MSKKLMNLLLVVVMLAVLVPTALAAPPVQGGGQDYVVVADDWLSKLADKYLGNPLAYPAIVEYTNKKNAEDSSYAKITNPDLIEVGWKVYIPSAEEAAAALAAAPGGLSGQLQLAGSTTVQPLAEKLAEAFMAKNPDVVVEIQGGGSSVGVTSAGEGTVDIGNASREIKSSELEKFPNLKVFTIAYDGIAIVTNPGLKLPGLSKEQVQAIFAGEVTNFKDVGGPDAAIIVVSREEGSGTRAAFEELVMEYKDASGEKKVKPIYEKALLQQSNGQVRTTVATTPNSVGYLSFGFLDASIASVPVGGVAPTVDNVKNGSYPIVRPLNMLTNGEPKPLAKAFLDYILSADGQTIVAEDYVTVK
jgi:phosphate transport system substrate-binding protein